MRDILTQHKSLKSLEESEIYDRLLKEIFNHQPEEMNITKKLGEELASLLGAHSLPAPVVTFLSRPWQRANMLSTWNDKLDLPNRKEFAKSIVQKFENIKRDFLEFYDTIATFMLFENAIELNIDKFLYYFDKPIKFIEDFIQYKFAPGQAYSTDYFKRHALNSLFYMGKKMGLSEEGSPTQLNEYIHIVTNRLYQDIGQDHYKFNKINFIAKYDENKNNMPIEFIYNPYCELTNAMLSDITTRFLIL